MTANAIRVQLPGGDIYAPAMHEAAAKTCARSGLPKKTTKAFVDLVTASLDVLNSGDSTMITLEMTVHDDAMSAKLTGKGCASPTKRLATRLDKLASSKAQSFKSSPTKTALTISFDV